MNIFIKDPETKAEYCIIWMHGLGADASDMAGLANELTLGNIAVRHIFMNAPIRPVTLNNGLSMPAWYDIAGMKLTDREDRQGIEASFQRIKTVIEGQIEQGFKPNQIFLAGFSQGGAMALYTGLKNPELAGVIALSAYLPLATELTAQLAKNTPFFIAQGLFDPIVLPAWTGLSISWLETAGYAKLSTHSYPMEHSVCPQEIADLSNWIKLQIVGRI